MPGTRKLGRDTAHRLAMLRGLVTFFFENGKIETTATRAQEVRALAEKMITIAKGRQSREQKKRHGLHHEGERYEQAVQGDRAEVR